MIHTISCVHKYLNFIFYYFNYVYVCLSACRNTHVSAGALRSQRHGVPWGWSCKLQSAFDVGLET